MVRVVCTWVLIVLAAAPFTACDVTTFLGDHSSPVFISSVAACADTADCFGVDDAGRLSALVVQVVLTRDWVLTLRDSPSPRGFERPAAVRSMPGEGPVGASPLQSTVLRL